MTFDEIVTEILDRADLRSPEATTRVGRAVNRLYRSVTTTTGLNTTRTALGVSSTITLGTSDCSFLNMEKVTHVYESSTGVARHLTEITLTEMRELRLGTGVPTRWAVEVSDYRSVVVLFDTVAAADIPVFADGYTTVADLSGSDVPVIPVSFHDILIEGVLVDEYRKQGQKDYAKDSKTQLEQRLSELRYFIAKSAYLDIYQGKLQRPRGFSAGNSGSTGSGLINADTVDGYHGAELAALSEDETITGLWGFADDVVLLQVDNTIRTNTADGADNKSISVAGGGANGSTRGAGLYVAGNEVATFGGTLWLSPGDAAGSYVRITKDDGLTPIVDFDGATGLTTLYLGQLKFPATQNPSTNANTLDDYEEGNWTPAWGGSGGQSGQTYSSQTGRYIKIGKMVYATGRIILSALGTITTNLQIQGLPFSAANLGAVGTVHIGYWANMGANLVYMGGFVNANATTASITGLTAAAASHSNLAQASLTASSDVFFTIMYEAGS